MNRRKGGTWRQSKIEPMEWLWVAGLTRIVMPMEGLVDTGVA